MSDMENITLKDIRDVLQKCFRPSLVPEEEISQFNEDLRNILQIIWKDIAESNFVEKYKLLLSSRLAVKGTEYLIKPKSNFLKILVEAVQCGPKFEIKELNVNVNIKSVTNFRFAVTYGFISSLNKNDFSYTPEYNMLYNHIINSCKSPSLSYQYRPILIDYFDKFREYMTKDNYNEIFEIFYYSLNVATLNSSLFRNLCDVLNVEHILTTILNTMSWKYKEKYVLLLGIVQNKPIVVETLPHEDIAKGIVFSQATPHLTQLGELLYSEIRKSMHDDIWKNIYYPAFKKAIHEEENITLCARNILQRLLKPEYLSLEKFMYMWEDTEKSPITFTYLCIVKTGLKMGIKKPEFENQNLIKFGIDHADCYIRALSFEICTYRNIKLESTYDLLQINIQLNINDANSTLRDLFIKAYKDFLKRIENAMCTSEKISIKNPVWKHSGNFFRWLFPYLFKQFTIHSNFQRTSLSLAYLYATLNSFSRNKILTGKKINFSDFIKVLKISPGEHTNKIISLIVSEMDTTKINNSLQSIETEAFSYLNSTNRDINTNGVKLLRLMYSLYPDQREYQYKNIIMCIYNQWEEIKTSTSQSIIENNPLHPALSVVNSFLKLKHEDKTNEILYLVEDIVSNLLNNVFASQQQKNITCCIGVSECFRSENSKYHKATVNCLWLVLKECCRICAKITEILQTDEAMNLALKLLHNVINKCFHKGALEEAGDNLANVIHSATKDGYCHEVINTFLSEILESLPHTPVSVSNMRRAAETRVVLSTLAVNDRQLFKPVFHKTMRCLLNYWKDCLENKTDSKCVQFLALIVYCIHPIITNRLVEIEVLDYSTEIFSLSLKSFDITTFNIHNANLQSYSAVCNKILGNVINRTGSIAENNACLEEIFFKYPIIYNQILEVIQNHQNNKYVIPPLMAFFSTSYVRNDELIECTQVQKNELKRALLIYLNSLHMSSFPPIMVAANAYKSLCTHNDINEEIIRIFQNLDESNIFYSFYLIKLLCDKISSDIGTLPNCNIFNTVKDTVNSFNSQLISSNFNRTLHFVLLINPHFKKISANDIIVILENMSTNSQNFSEIWDLIITNLIHVIKTENISDCIELLNKCLCSNIPLNLRHSVLETFKERIIKNPEEIKQYHLKLIDILISDLLNHETNHSEFITEQCVEILLLLDLRNCSTHIKNIMSEKMNDIVSEKKLTIYVPIIASMFCNANPNFIIKEQFFKYICDICLEYIEKENTTTILFKSVRYLLTYADESQNSILMRDTLKIIFKILQRGEPEFRDLSTEILSVCPIQKPIHTYSYMMIFLQKPFLLALLDSYYTIQLLTELYCERPNKIYSLAAFDDETVLAIEIYIVEDIIFDVLKDIFVNNVNDSTRTNIVEWFNKFVKQNRYKTVLKNSIFKL